MVFRVLPTPGLSSKHFCVFRQNVAKVAEKDWMVAFSSETETTCVGLGRKRGVVWKDDL